MAFVTKVCWIRERNTSWADLESVTRPTEFAGRHYGSDMAQ